MGELKEDLTPKKEVNRFAAIRHHRLSLNSVHNRTLDVTTNPASRAFLARVDTYEMGKKPLTQDSGKVLLSNNDISLSLSLTSPLS